MDLHSALSKWLSQELEPNLSPGSAKIFSTNQGLAEIALAESIFNDFEKDFRSLQTIGKADTQGCQSG